MVTIVTLITEVIDGDGDGAWNAGRGDGAGVLAGPG
jgi:hypothetical protein